MSVLSMRNVAKELDIKLSTLVDIAFMHLLKKGTHYELEDSAKTDSEDWVLTVQGLLKITMSLPEEKYAAIGRLIAIHEIEKSGILAAAQNILDLNKFNTEDKAVAENKPSAENKSVKASDNKTATTKSFGAFSHSELYNADEHGLITTKDGMKFRTVKDLVAHYKLKNRQVVYDGIYAGKNINDIIWPGNKKVKNGRVKKSGHHARQADVKDVKTLALWGWDEKSQNYIAPNGQPYSSIEKMCNAYGLPYPSVRYHIVHGKSFKEVVDAIKHSTNPKRISLVKQNEKPKARPKTLTGEGLPALTDAETAWIEKMDQLMESKKLKSVPANKIRYAVYQHMRNVYGIVLTQAMHDYMETWNIDAKTHCSYYYMVAQSPKLASLFESILTDMAKDGIPA